jgi:serine/threonine protein kinase
MAMQAASCALSTDAFPFRPWTLTLLIFLRSHFPFFSFHLSYAAPEMIAGREYCGPLADIWSMGIILFALVCGYLPFEDPNTANLYKKILSGRVPRALICSAL